MSGLETKILITSNSSLGNVNGSEDLTMADFDFLDGQGRAIITLYDQRMANITSESNYGRFEETIFVEAMNYAIRASLIDLLRIERKFRKDRVRWIDRLNLIFRSTRGEMIQRTDNGLFEFVNPLDINQKSRNGRKYLDDPNNIFVCLNSTDE